MLALGKFRCWAGSADSEPGWLSERESARRSAPSGDVQAATGVYAASTADSGRQRAETATGAGAARSAAMSSQPPIWFTREQAKAWQELNSPKAKPKRLRDRKTSLEGRKPFHVVKENKCLR